MNITISSLGPHQPSTWNTGRIFMCRNIYRVISGPSTDLRKKASIVVSSSRPDQSSGNPDQISTRDGDSRVTERLASSSVFLTLPGDRCHIQSEIAFCTFKQSIVFIRRFSNIFRTVSSNLKFSRNAGPFY